MDREACFNHNRLTKVSTKIFFNLSQRQQNFNMLIVYLLENNYSHFKEITEQLLSLTTKAYFEHCLNHNGLFPKHNWLKPNVLKYFRKT